MSGLNLIVIILILISFPIISTIRVDDDETRFVSDETYSLPFLRPPALVIPGLIKLNLPESRSAEISTFLTFSQVYIPPYLNTTAHICVCIFRRV